MSDNKFLEDYQYMKENGKHNGKYLIQKYNEYGDNELLYPLDEEIKKIINIWDISILDSLDYNDKDLDELFRQRPVMKNLDIQCCFDFLFEFKIYNKKALSKFLEKIKNYDESLKSFLSKKVKRCIDHNLYYCNILYKKEEFKLIGLNNNFDSLYYSILNSLYYNEYGETLIEKETIKSLSIWNKYNIVNRLVNVNGMVIPFKELVISVCQEYKTILEENEENIERSKYENICFNIMDDEYIDTYLNNIFDNWTSIDSDIITEQYKLRLLAYYAMIINLDFKINNTNNNLYKLILEFDTYPNYIYNNGPCYPNTPAGIVEIVSLCSILDYNIVVLHHQDDLFYYDNNHGYSEKRDNTIYLYKDDYNVYFSLIKPKDHKTEMIKLLKDNYVKPQIIDVKKVMEEFEKSIKDAQSKIEEQSRINSDLNSTATKKVSKKKMEQIQLVISNISQYEFKRLSHFVELELNNIDDVNKYIEDIDYYRKIVDGIKHIKTVIGKILINKNESIESKICNKYFRQDILDLFQKSSNMKVLLNNLNDDEINNFCKIIKYIGNSNKDIKNYGTAEKKTFILDTYLTF
tara:strand:- start:12520 stop:14247 length:1728 start_codon:yes stop_codon:yes gene_type:complete